jgi:ABC-type phosphate transport system substrate-binding protein
MNQIYHYATVSKALDELNENGFTYDFNLHEQDIAKNPQKYEIKHVYRYEGNTDPGDEAVVYGIQSKSGKKGVFVAGFAANSISDAAQILININIKNRTK